VHDLIEKLLNLCRTHLKNDRLSSSLIKTIDLIVQNGFLNDDTLKKYRIEFLNLFLENVRVSKNVQKLNAYVDFFCDMLQFESTENEVKENRVRERAMIQLMIMLCHQYPIVRKTTASKLFECIMSYPDIFDKEEENDECVTLLVDTVWDEPVVNLRPIRNRICDLTKTPKPVMKNIDTTILN
jgi:tubulin-specific chaperone D